VFLQRNRISGIIPSEMGRIEGLRGLNLDDNEITGPIPSEIGLCATVHFLAFGGNDITGHIPIELFNLKLEALHAELNRITGSIPTNIGQLQQLFSCKILIISSKIVHFTSGSLSHTFDNLYMMQ